MKKKIPGFDGYHADMLGNIYSTARRDVFGRKIVGRILSQCKKPNGYMKVTLCKNGVPYTRHVHSIMAATFIGKKKNGYVVNHKNGVKTDNRLANLEYVTHKENHRHSRWVLGNMNGYNHWKSVITPWKAFWIRTMRAAGESQYRIAKKLKISQSVVSTFLRGASYRAIGMP